MHRAYCPNIDFHPDASVTITDKDEIHHVKNVLRGKSGDPVRIFNGKGKEAAGIISSVSAQSVSVLIHSVLPKSPRNTRLILACAIPKKIKFDGIVEKATELGADRIIPMLTERTEVRLDGARAKTKHSRYETIALNAARQAQRSILPVIDPPCTFAKALELVTPETLALFPYLDAENRIPLYDALRHDEKKKTIICLIGPEGDFTENEIKSALSAGCLPVTLGSTTLKVDTAAICILSAVRTFLKL